MIKLKNKKPTISFSKLNTANNIPVINKLKKTAVFC